MNAEMYYERCRALLAAIGSSKEDADKETLLWMLEEQLACLGEAIGIFQKRQS